MTYRIAYLGPVYPWLHQLLCEKLPEGFEFVPLTSGTREEEEQIVADADFVVAIHADGDLIRKMKKARLIQYHGTGYHGKIDLAACREMGIPLATAPGGNTVEVAEHAIMLILAVLRILPIMHNAVQRGEWPMWEQRMRLHNLEGKTVGIIGFGRIGRAVAQRALAFDTRIQYYDVIRADPQTEEKFQAQFCSLDELLTTSDVVVLNIPITPETRGMLDAARLRQMKPTAILVNVARGEVVDEQALYTALKEGWIAGAGLDVFAHEPINPDCPLLTLDNVVLSPHVASGTKDSLQKKARAWYENFLRVLDGKEPNDLVAESIQAASPKES